MARKFNPGFRTDATSGNSQSAKRGAINALISKGDKGPFEIGVVVEIINDPVYFAEKIAPAYEEADLISRREEWIKFPRNTLLVSVEGDHVGSSLIPCVPFYSSHIGLPVKVGETVWISDDGSSYKYWHSRVGGERLNEDVNLSIRDAKFESPNEGDDDAKSANEAEQGTKQKILPNLFPKLRDDIDNFKADRKEKKDAKQKAKEQEGEESSGLRDIKDRSKTLVEPIPRWTPRQGDYFLQGSNNTLISLGTDRGWSIDTENYGKYSNAHTEAKPLSGTIDIVVGRGQYEVEPLTDTSDGSIQGTAPRTIQTSDDEPVTIVNKTPAVNNLKDNPQEGDPHFETDLSRIYVSMNSEVDKNFYPKDKYGLLYLQDEEYVEDKSGPTIAMQTNHFRVYAKPEGDIRIVKQGEPDTSQSSIILHHDGKITISGDHIIMGRRDENNDTDHAEPYSAQPWIKYSDLYHYFEEFHNLLNDFMSQVEINRSPGHFATDVVLKNAARTFKRKQKALFDDKIKLIRSERIWGE